MSIRHRSRQFATSEWLAAIALATLLGLGAGAMRRNAPAATPFSDAAFVRALGGSTGILAVVNPVNCMLTARDVAVLNAVAATPGVRVTVLLLAVAPDDSVIQTVRRDFAFASSVVVAMAAKVDPNDFPEPFRAPFIAVLSRGQLRHAAWGQSLKGLHAWLPVLAGLSGTAGQTAQLAP